MDVERSLLGMEKEAMKNPLIKIESKDGFHKFVLSDDLQLSIGADGMAHGRCPLGKFREMILTPADCRNALFEERDLWH